ncbi:MAG: DUF58 domain-containing protein [Cyanobacteria bacterium J06639_1]
MFDALPIPARRFYLLFALIGAIAFALAALLGDSVRLAAGWGVWGVGNTALAIATVWDARRSRPDRPTLHRQELERLSVGRENRIVLEIDGGDRGAIADIYDDRPHGFEGSTLPLRTSIRPHERQQLAYTVTPSSRGEFPWGDLYVRQLSRGQLAWQQWRVPQPTTAAVYPDLNGLRSLSVKLAVQSSGTLRQALRRGAGTEFAELREYVTGDDPRFIDWKATARRGTPLVRVLEPEQEQTLIVLLDRGRLMTAQVRGLSRFDWGLNATLSLALAGIHRGDRVGVGVFDRRMHVWIPPERGTKHLPHLIERLTPIQPVLMEPDYLGAATQLVQQQSRRALVVVITDIVDTTASAELLTAMSRLTPRYLPLCVALRDPEVDRRAHGFTTAVDAAFERAVAIDLLAQRQVAFATLKQQGVLVLDTPADGISETLVDRYLQLKARNRI